eukprot:CAMPEP_0182559832 /NCGR_PEP_ID=MMETSP1324-20130603/2808_1 /TAXON_ID=236786 /ORGANISM="Florenciella sp., Strain RCC1587" /LENGTH=88 /DNA_ID=CAMNT_0024772145 /DNA_START=563 /DNA_END=829 /DNA_ORIENTATION=-
MVNEIYRDLGAIVDEQQGQVDDIESMINSTTSKTKDGIAQLDKAKKHQKGVNKGCAWVLCFLVLVLLGVGGFVFWDEIVGKSDDDDGA